jgi:hypothetical protein
MNFTCENLFCLRDFKVALKRLINRLFFKSDVFKPFFEPCPFNYFVFANLFKAMSSYGIFVKVKGNFLELFNFYPEKHAAEQQPCGRHTASLSHDRHEAILTAISVSSNFFKNLMN